MLPERMGNEKRIDVLRALAARMAASGGKRVAITPESALAVAHALQAYADQLSRPVGEYPTFTVDVWQGEHVIERLAGCSNLLVARAAYEQAVKERSRHRVTMRNGIPVIAEHKGDLALAVK